MCATTAKKEPIIFPDVFSHLCQAHSSEDVKFRSLELNEMTGKFGYRTKHFAGTTASSYNITVTGDNELNIVPRKPETVEQNTCLEEHYSTTDKPEITSDDTISELYDIIPVVKSCIVFLIYAQNIHCWYSLEPPP